MQPMNSSMLRGIDVSKWQGDIDWAKVKATGLVHFAYCKATEGYSYVDPNVTKNVNGAKANGIPVGLYHFGNPVNDVHQEASNFIKLLKALPTDLLPVLDMEVPATMTTTVDGGIKAAQIVAWVKQFAALVKQATGKDIILYTGGWYVNMFGISGLSDIPLWVASYTSTVADCGGWTNYVAWQYTDKGLVNGISGSVDLDVAVSLEALKGEKAPMYSTTKIKINGKPYSDGIVVNGSTYVLWSALDVLGIKHTYKGNGLMNVNGKDVQGVVYSGDTYLPWTCLGAKPTAITGGWNFTVTAPAPALVKPVPDTQNQGKVESKPSPAPVVSPTPVQPTQGNSEAHSVQNAKPSITQAELDTFRKVLAEIVKILGLK